MLLPFYLLPDKLLAVFDNKSLVNSSYSLSGHIVDRSIIALGSSYGINTCSNRSCNRPYLVIALEQRHNSNNIYTLSLGRFASSEMESVEQLNLIASGYNIVIGLFA